MCSACGFPARPGHWTDAGFITASDRLQARFRRAAVLRRVLAPYGLTAHDDGVTSGLQLSTLSGAHLIVETPEALWAGAARLAGRPVDPLETGAAGPGDG